MNYLPDAKAFSSAIDVIGITIATAVKARLGSRAMINQKNYRISKAISLCLVTQAAQLCFKSRNALA